MRASVQDPIVVMGAVAGGLLLAVAATAAEPLVSVLPPGPSCQADAPPVDPNALAAVARELQKLQDQPESPDAAPIVALDNRGYNYGRGPGPDLLQMQRELIQLHLETQQPNPQ